MLNASLMLQGTGSNVGKSLLVAGLCRVFTNRGLKVRPFKPQNMSNNAAVTPEGGEIGRAQALQALACKIPPHTDMNPVLIKPESDSASQIVVQGKVAGRLNARDWHKRDHLLTTVQESFERLRKNSDLVIIEGAGSPAETNLRKGDIANMGFAEAVNTPVILIGDIDKGGVIAQIVGTKAVLSNADTARIKGFLVNKFRGDISLFEEGYQDIIHHTQWQGFGTIPWFYEAAYLPAEDAVDIMNKGNGAYHIAVPMLPRIANFDDLDPLSAEPNVRVTMVPPGRPLPRDADLIIIPGTKSTIADTNFFREQGWDIDLHAHIRAGGHVIGICGGYQMLGQSISDPEGIEGNIKAIKGLGYLAVSTLMAPQKTTGQVKATYQGQAVEAYEIHMGISSGPDCARPFFTVNGKSEGAVSQNGRIMGTYLHGCFTSDPFRKAFLRSLGVTSSAQYSKQVDEILDGLAAHLERYVDCDALLKVATTS